MKFFKILFFWGGAENINLTLRYVPYTFICLI
jgi:hypothetical protein